MTEYKILIVDDEPNFIETMANIVEKAGEPYEILSAVNAETAYNIATSHLPSLIITDWEMPYMSGLELIEKLKSNPKTKQIPIIMCTGLMTSSKNLMMALEAGAVDYIRKPIDAVEFLARTRSTLVLIQSFKIIQQQQEELFEKENELLHNNLETKDKELTTNTLNHIHTQEIMISIAQELEQILDINKDENIERHIGNLIKKLNINSSETNWEEFRVYFEKVHSNFFNRLLENCPKLTQNDLRICALLKLNFSTKDISSLTHQSPRSVDVARYRLRKKLNLSQEENLVSFLAGF